LAFATLLAAALQVVAVFKLAAARVDELAAVAARGPSNTVWVIAVAAALALATWLLRRRPRWALAFAVLWPAPTFLWARTRVDLLELALHGEHVLYHFTAVLAAAVIVGHVVHWAVLDPRLHALGWRRYVPLPLGLLGASALVLAHAASLPALEGQTSVLVRGMAGAGTAALFLAWPIAALALWPATRGAHNRVVVFAMLLPYAARIAFTEAAPLNGGPVTPLGATVVGAAIVVTALVVGATQRVRLEVGVKAVIGTVCAIFVIGAYLLYRRYFGVFEDGLDGILRSFLGFSVPYPAHSVEWRASALLVAFYLITYTVYVTLVATAHRPRGLALALFAVAGLGLSSPHLVLLVGAAWTTWLDAICDDDAADVGLELADVDGRVLDALAARLGLPEPIHAEEIVAMAGAVDGVPVDLRQRARVRRTAELALTIGVPGRETAEVALVPDTGRGGVRPVHALAKTHRVVGEVRLLERHGDRVLDALSALPRARLELWPAGATVRTDGEVDVDALDAIVRALVAALRA
jgi:hypothetical protein